MADLSSKQMTFVREYLVDLNATQAATRAGYSPRTANEQGARLLAKASVAEAVQAGMDARAARTEITADYVLQSIVSTMERCKQVEPVYDRKGDPVMVGTPDGELAQAFTFNAAGVLKGAELLGRHLKLFTEKVEHTGKDGGPIEVDQRVKEDADAVASALARLAERARAHGVDEQTKH